ncbi:hypothetical protein PRUPE_1G000300 [Prunus persica]|uniref:Importin-7/11-like TPR repeats domain-containing protein n=2 Tax=Prunus persica TaxID=3760 RepID=A0A251QQE5_PRUPE|nr:hypothetical protein PRUPE_1G000300 [Prunus persica]
MSEVMPFANKLILFFQKVWEESSGECLLQIQLLVALRNFVVALGYQSPICYDILLPILQKGIDIDSPDELNLLEDSMLLWEATLSHAPSMVPQLLAYFPCVVKIMERSFDHLQIAVSITEDYIILGGSEFLSIHASSVAQILDLVVGNVNDRGLLSTLPVIDILIQCFPLEVPQLISSTLQADNVSSIQRKTYGLALSIILTLRLPQVLNKLDQILSVCTTVILGGNDDLTEESSGDNITSSGSLSKGTIPSKEFRRRQLKFSDPINQMSLDASVRENLQTCATLHGESFNKAIGCMHPSAFSQLKQALKMA